MTGRVCEVHGEWTATGVCQWCEKQSGADQATIALPPTCICKTCLRGFEAPIPLTSLECPECRAKPKTLLDVALSGPKVRPLPVMESTPWAGKPREWRLDGVPSPTGYETAFTLTEKIADAYVWRLEWNEPYIDAETHAAEQARLAAQHAALRWERVARRWNYKHREVAGLDEWGRALVWRHWLDQMARRYLHITWTPGQPP